MASYFQSKEFKDLLFTGLILALFGFGAVSGLAMVNYFTEERIDQANKMKTISAMQDLFSPMELGYQTYFYKIPDIEGDLYAVYQSEEGEKNIESLQQLKQDESSQIIGYAVRSNPKTGYSGLIKMIVGINADLSLAGYRIIEHNETPGLGAEATADYFRNAFKSTASNKIYYEEMPKSRLEFKKVFGIDTISGATITSMAMVDGVKLAYEQLFNQVLE